MDGEWEEVELPTLDSPKDERRPNDGNNVQANNWERNTTKDINKIREEEIKLINERRKYFGMKTVEEEENSGQKEQSLTGVSFSGGGIRSACYCMGALQGMAERGFLKRIDILSTVSGGGYAGSSYLTHVDATSALEDAVVTLDAQMRENVGYFINTQHWFKAIAHTLVMVMAIVMLLLLGRVLFFPLWSHPLIFLFEYILGNQFIDAAQTGHLTKGMKIFYLTGGMTIGFLLWWTSRALHHYERRGNPVRYAVVNAIRAGVLQLSFLFSFALFAWAWYFVYTEPSTVFLTLAIVVFGTGNLLALTNIDQVHMFALAGPIFFVGWVSLFWFLRLQYSPTLEEIDNVQAEENLNSTLTILWFVAIVSIYALHSAGWLSLMRNYYKWRLKASFYNKAALIWKCSPFYGYMSSTYPFAKTADLCRQKGAPYYLCNATLSGFRRHLTDLDYSHFLFSPLYCGSHPTGWTPTRVLGVSLEEAMGLSGAAFAVNMGKVDVGVVERNRAILSALGLEMGDFIAWPKQARLFVTDNLYSLLVILLFGAGNFLSSVDLRYTLLIAAGYLIFLGRFLARLLPIRAKLNCSIHSNRYYQALGISPIEKPPSGFVYLTDGGHVENLGLGPLLERQCEVMISFDCGYDPQMTCKEFLSVIQTYDKKGYTFTHLENNKLHSASKSVKEWAKSSAGDQAFIQIDVWYPDGKKGRLYFVKLRKHQDDPHNGLKPFLSSVFGTYPWISTGNQFFTRELYDAYTFAGKRDALEVLPVVDRDQHIYNTMLLKATLSLSEFLSASNTESNESLRQLLTIRRDLAKKVAKEKPTMEKPKKKEKKQKRN